MKKQDLKTGMTVKLRDGSLLKVMLGTTEGDIVVRESGSYRHLDGWEDDLTAGCHRDCDIVAVLDTSGFHLSCFEGPVLWRRNEIELTLKVNGKEVSPCEISEETWKNLRK